MSDCTSHVILRVKTQKQTSAMASPKCNCIGEWVLVGWLYLSKRSSRGSKPVKAIIIIINLSSQSLLGRIYYHTYILHLLKKQNKDKQIFKQFQSAGKEHNDLELELPPHQLITFLSSNHLTTIIKEGSSRAWQHLSLLSALDKRVKISLPFYFGP